MIMGKKRTRGGQEEDKWRRTSGGQDPTDQRKDVKVDATWERQMVDRQ